jgi:O-succinylbenzoate synthase
VVKLKVGMAARDEEEIARVAAVRAAIGPDIALRLDANGAWTPEQAITMLRRLADFDLALVEQPVPAWDIEGLARVRRSVSVPIAADEAVTSREAVEQLCAAEAVDALVLKLPVVGGITVAHALAELAARHQCAIVVTSVFEAGIGLAAALHTAAAVPGELLACGLATASSLVTPLVIGLPEPIHGQLAIPHHGPGLGVTLDEEALRCWADLMEDRHVITHAGD